jgi:cytidylate kinase
MHFRTVPQRLMEARARALENRYARTRAESATNVKPHPWVPSAFTIAISREAGTYGAAIARQVGDRLGWPVYDKELLQRIGQELGVGGSSLERMDERHADWLNECLEGFSFSSAVSQPVYIRHLVATMLALAAQGECVIVGRGATKVLPQVTTLRVRLVAPLKHRIESVQRERGLSYREAARHVEATDRDRDRFVKDHFQIDAKDPRNYDLILNVASYLPAGCVELILAALDHLRVRRQEEHGSPAAMPHSEGRQQPWPAPAVSP